MEIKVEVVAREIINPSSPTPHHLRTFKLSLLDQYAPPLYIPIILLYSGNIHGTGGGGGDSGQRDDNYEENVRARSQLLKESLSKTLTQFYPLAGRLKGNLSVDCNDEGAHYLEARVINDCLSDLLERPKFEDLIHFSVTNPTEELGEDPPLLILKASFFPCGGLALGVSMSHKIADGAAINTFLKGWSDAALGNPDAVVPDFTSASSRFPPKDDIPFTQLLFKEMRLQKPVIKRFVFEAPKIAALQAKSASASVKQPTRVEAVTALVWKCAIAASRPRLGGSRKAYAFMGGVNLRARLDPPLPEHSFGNLVGPWWAMVDNDEDDYESEITDLPGFVCRLRKGVEESTDENLFDKVAKLRELKADVMEAYRYSCWCRFPTYEVDFGWGKPTWVTGGNGMFPNVIFVLDTRVGGGVEVWMNLVEEDMALFECDMELLAFASPNPSAL